MVAHFRGIAAIVLFCAISLFPQTSEAGAATPLKGAIGQALTLDPTDGMTLPTGGGLSPSWSWISRPSTSVAAFSDPDTLRPSVTPDVPGTYVAELALSAADGTVAATTRVTFGTENLPPVAKARVRGLPDGTTPVVIDGSDSYDVDGDASGIPVVSGERPRREQLGGYRRRSRGRTVA